MSKKQENSAAPIFKCMLNFAFCPSSALSIKDDKFANKQIDNMLKEFPNQDANDLKNSLRYFYICYSFKIEDVSFENKEYFYFQIFSKIAGHLNPEDPIFGFFEKEKITSMIQDINETFNPQNHDKTILDSFSDYHFLNTDDIVLELQKWTELKLIDFNNFYLADQDVLFNLIKIIENEKKFLACQKKKKRLQTNTKNEKRKKPTNRRTTS
jgi:hypothetical protein